MHKDIIEGLLISYFTWFLCWLYFTFYKKKGGNPKGEENEMQICETI